MYVYIHVYKYIYIHVYIYIHIYIYIYIYMCVGGDIYYELAGAWEKPINKATVCTFIMGMFQQSGILLAANKRSCRPLDMDVDRLWPSMATDLLTKQLAAAASSRTGIRILGGLSTWKASNK